ncbi:hypothetical protein CCMA1212_001357 [Trichoderma ghanense]|uniref:Uncharacterized protein n=1 Tax=Trichoderma ghanense TaxID=65468 RepID=A0ABY2HGD1_9HYPO
MNQTPSLHFQHKHGPPLIITITPLDNILHQDARHRLLLQRPVLPPAQHHDRPLALLVTHKQLAPVPAQAKHPRVLPPRRRLPHQLQPQSSPFLVIIILLRRRRRNDAKMGNRLRRIRRQPIRRVKMPAIPRKHNLPRRRKRTPLRHAPLLSIPIAHKRRIAPRRRKLDIRLPVLEPKNLDAITRLAQQKVMRRRLPLLPLRRTRIKHAMPRPGPRLDSHPPHDGDMRPQRVQHEHRVRAKVVHHEEAPRRIDHRLVRVRDPARVDDGVLGRHRRRELRLARVFRVPDVDGALLVGGPEEEGALLVEFEVADALAGVVALGDLRELAGGEV